MESLLPMIEFVIPSTTLQFLNTIYVLSFSHEFPLSNKTPIVFTLQLNPSVLIFLSFSDGLDQMCVHNDQHQGNEL